LCDGYQAYRPDSARRWYPGRAVDTNKEVGDVDHLKLFATPEAADEWFKENNPDDVAFE
jgi:hypothetical protein